MREIKFRAWDKKLEVMGDMLYMDFEGKIFDSMYGELEAADRENFVLMQYTGLKDKNGIEIYEGDIIKWRWKRCWQENYHIATPTWNQQWCCYYLVELEKAFQTYRMRDDIEYEIIGNICKNPKLLAGEHDE